MNPFNRLSRPSFLLLVVLCGSLVYPLNGQQTVTAKRGDLDLDVHLPGVFVADDNVEIKVEPKKYVGDLIVTRIVAEGVTVKPGDVLLEFDDAKVVEAIDEAKNEATDASVELQKAKAQHRSAEIEQESKLFQLNAELKVLQREVAADKAKQELDLEEKRKAIVRAEESLEQSKVDMKMLTDIYEERGLQTSTSGDILLERQKQVIENSIKSIDFQRKQLAYFEQFDKTKTQLDKELDIDKKQAEIKKQTITLAAATAEKLSLVVKAQRKMDAASQKVADLELDRQQSKIVSPRGGVVLYGPTKSELPAGVVINFAGQRSVRDELRIGGRIRTHEILMTIANMQRLSIKMDAPENDIRHLKTGQSITVYPAAFPKESFAGQLMSVEQIATSNPFYGAANKNFAVLGQCNELTTELRSGMNCRVTIHTKTAENVLLLPVHAVFANKDNSLFCYVKSGDEFEKRSIEIGFSNSENVAVLSGLTENDEVCVTVPENVKSPGNKEVQE